MVVNTQLLRLDVENIIMGNDLSTLFRRIMRALVPTTHADRPVPSTPHSNAQSGYTVGRELEHLIPTKPHADSREVTGSFHAPTVRVSASRTPGTRPIPKPHDRPHCQPVACDPVGLLMQMALAASRKPTEQAAALHAAHTAMVLFGREYLGISRVDIAAADFSTPNLGRIGGLERARVTVQRVDTASDAPHSTRVFDAETVPNAATASSRFPHALTDPDDGTGIRVTVGHSPRRDTDDTHTSAASRQTTDTIRLQNDRTADAPLMHGESSSTPLATAGHTTSRDASDASHYHAHGIPLSSDGIPLSQSYERPVAPQTPASGQPAPSTPIPTNGPVWIPSDHSPRAPTIMQPTPTGSERPTDIARILLAPPGTRRADLPGKIDLARPPLPGHPDHEAHIYQQDAAPHAADGDTHRTQQQRATEQAAAKSGYTARTPSRDRVEADATRGDGDRDQQQRGNGQHHGRDDDEQQHQSSDDAAPSFA